MDFPILVVRLTLLVNDFSPNFGLVDRVQREEEEDDRVLRD
jgi:hypothetical protein